MPPKHSLHYPLQKKFGLTNNTLAIMTGYAPPTISSFMNCRRRFPVMEKRLHDLLKFLEVNFPNVKERARK